MDRYLNVISNKRVKGSVWVLIQLLRFEVLQHALNPYSKFPPYVISNIILGEI